MSQITISKGKILKGDKIEITYTRQDSNIAKPVECNETHSDAPHPDLIAAFASLKVHAAIAGGFISSKLIKDANDPVHEDMNTISVSGFTIVGDDEGVIITAQRHTVYGSTGFNTPTIRFASDSYPFTKELETHLGTVKDEFREYLNGKFAPDPQGTLFEEKK